MGKNTYEFVRDGRGYSLMVNGKRPTNGGAIIFKRSVGKLRWLRSTWTAWSNRDMDVKFETLEAAKAAGIKWAKRKDVE